MLYSSCLEELTTDMPTPGSSPRGRRAWRELKPNQFESNQIPSQSYFKIKYKIKYKYKYEYKSNQMSSQLYFKNLNMILNVPVDRE